MLCWHFFIFYVKKTCIIQFLFLQYFKNYVYFEKYGSMGESEKLKGGVVKKKLSTVLVLTMMLSNMNMFSAHAMEAAEDILFEDIPMVQSAAFFATKATKAPGNTVSIDNKKLTNTPVRTLADAIDYFAPGMISYQHEFSGTMLAARGVGVDNNAKTLLLYDGVNINERSHIGSQSEFGVPLMGDIASIEVANGPNAIVHGSGAINGFINVITKNGADYQRSFFTAEYGATENLRKTEFGHGEKFADGKDLFVYLGYVEATGVKGDAEVWSNDFSRLDSGRSGDIIAGIRTQGFRPSYKFSTNFRWDDFSLKVLFTDYNQFFNGANSDQASQNRLPSWGGGNADDPYVDASYMNVSKLSIAPKYTINFSDSTSLDLNANVQYMQHFRDTTYAPNDTNVVGNDTPKDNFITGERAGSREAHYEFKPVFRTTMIDKHSLAVGGLIGRKEFRDNDTYIHGGTEINSADALTMHWKEKSAFAEDIFDITDAWVLSAGVRYDSIHNSPAKSGLRVGYDAPDYESITHRFATAYEINPTTSVKLGYSEGYRTPDVGYYTRHARVSQGLINYGFAPLNDLKPEEMKTTELNVHFELPKARMKFDTNFYYNEYVNTLFWHMYDNNRYPRTDHEIDTIIGGVDKDTNTWEPNQLYWAGAMDNAAGKFRSKGLEFIVDWEPTNTTKVNMIYGYSKPDSIDDAVAGQMDFLTTNDKDDWMLFPTHTYKLTLRQSFLNDKLNASLAWQYHSGRAVSRHASFTDVYANHYSKLDLGLKYKMTEALELNFILKNALGEKTPKASFNGNPYQGALGQEKRYWYLSGTYKF